MNSGERFPVFCIGGMSVILNTPWKIKITNNFIPFLTDVRMDEVQVYYTEINEQLDVNRQLLYENIVYSVYRDSEGYYSIFQDHASNDKKIAVSRIISDSEVRVNCVVGNREYFNESHNCFSYIGLAELLLRRKAVILHSSFVRTEYGGILFTGPSGIGKSTQADLWCQYKRALLINGDRTILRKINGSWTGFGSPYAGSSRCFVNESEPVSAVAVLEQGENCEIQKLSQAEAFRKVYSGLTVNMWNPEYVERITAVTAEFVAEIPVYRMVCTPDRRAVEVLEDILRKESVYGRGRKTV